MWILVVDNAAKRSWNASYAALGYWVIHITRTTLKGNGGFEVACTGDDDYLGDWVFYPSVTPARGHSDAGLAAFSQRGQRRLLECGTHPAAHLIYMKRCD